MQTILKRKPFRFVSSYTQNQKTFSDHIHVSVGAVVFIISDEVWFVVLLGCTVGTEANSLGVSVIIPVVGDLESKVGVWLLIAVGFVVGGVDEAVGDWLFATLGAGLVFAVGKEDGFAEGLSGADVGKLVVSIDGSLDVEILGSLEFVATGAFVNTLEMVVVFFDNSDGDGVGKACDVAMAEFISGFDSVRSDWPNSIYEVNNIMMKIMQQQIGIKVRFCFFSFWDKL